MLSFKTMSIYKKILLAITGMILFYVFFKLLSGKQEGLTFFTTPDTQLSSLQNTTPVKIQSIGPVMYNLPLKEYVIKASYNSALTGKYINAEMVKYVISRGVRFLDFEVFLIKDKVYVGATTDTNVATLDTENSILVDKIFNTIMTNAFSSGKCPNSSDPLFINLRIKSTDHDAYKKLAKMIDFNFKSRVYDKKVTKETLLSEIMGKIVIIVDKTINPDYVKAARCKPGEKHCIDLNNHINLESGSEDLFLQKYGQLMEQYGIPIYTMNDNMRTNVQNMYLILPDSITSAKNPPNYINILQKYGSQIVPYCFYNNDTGLKQYEEFFDNNKAAFIPLSKVMQ